MILNRSPDTRTFISTRSSEDLQPNLRLKMRYIGFSFAFALMYQIPDWETIFQSVYGYPFDDRMVYEEFLRSPDFNIAYQDSFSPLMYVTFEFTWHKILYFLYEIMGLSSQHIFYLITTMLLWRFSYDVIDRLGVKYLPFLLNPLIVELAYSQLRFALAIFVFSFVCRGQRSLLLTLIVYILAITIHTTVIIFMVAQFSARFFQDINKKSIVCLILIGFSISLLIGPFREDILSIAGDRRAQYSDKSSSIEYLSFWIFLFIANAVQKKQNKNFWIFDTKYSLIILSSIFSSLIFGGYPARFIAACYPYLLSSMKRFEKNTSLLIFIMFAFYNFLLWVLWFRIL